MYLDARADTCESAPTCWLLVGVHPFFSSILRHPGALATPSVAKKKMKMLSVLHAAKVELRTKCAIDLRIASAPEGEVVGTIPANTEVDVLETHTTGGAEAIAQARVRYVPAGFDRGNHVEGWIKTVDASGRSLLYARRAARLKSGTKKQRLVCATFVGIACNVVCLLGLGAPWAGEMCVGYTGAGSSVCATLPMDADLRASHTLCTGYADELCELTVGKMAMGIEVRFVSRPQDVVARLPGSVGGLIGCVLQGASAIVALVALLLRVESRVSSVHRYLLASLLLTCSSLLYVGFSPERFEVFAIGAAAVAPAAPVATFEIRPACTWGWAVGYAAIGLYSIALAHACCVVKRRASGQHAAAMEMHGLRIIEMGHARAEE